MQKIVILLKVYCTFSDISTSSRHSHEKRYELGENTVLRDILEVFVHMTVVLFSSLDELAVT